MRYGPWQKIYLHACGKPYRVIDGEIAINFHKPCEKCGEYMNWRDTTRKVARCVYLTVWWKPWTWFSMDVEYKEG